MQSVDSASEGSGAASADAASNDDSRPDKHKGTGKDKKTSVWMNKSVLLASAVLRNDHVASKKIATQMSNHDVAGPLIKKHMDSQRWYWVIG